VRRHQSAVRNFLRRLARNDVDRANDLAQETFIKMYAGLNSYRGAARFSTWLYRIAYYVFLNDERGRRYKKGMTHAEIAEALELPLGTVKSDLVRGHEKLKEWLGTARGATQ
jgi:RNA polymerase sigma-70 factor (ECF subfamily)